MPSTRAIDALEQRQDVAVIDVGHDRLDLDLRIDPPQFVGSGDGFGQIGGDVVLVEEHLPLQVGDFDEIAVDDPQLPHARTRQGVGRHAAQCAATTNEHAAGQQPPLAFLSERSKADLTGITLKHWRFWIFDFGFWI